MENIEKIETITQSQEGGKIFQNYSDFYKEYSELRNPIVRIYNKKIENFLLVDSVNDFVDSYAFKITNNYANMNIEDENRKVIDWFVLKNDTSSEYQIELINRVL